MQKGRIPPALLRSRHKAEKEGALDRLLGVDELNSAQPQWEESYATKDFND